MFVVCCRMNVVPPYTNDRYRRSFRYPSSNFELAVGVNGGRLYGIVVSGSLEMYQSTGVSALEWAGWDSKKEILPESRPGRLDRRPKLPPLSYHIDMCGGVGEGVGGLSNVEEGRSSPHPLPYPSTHTYIIWQGRHFKAGQVLKCRRFFFIFWGGVLGRLTRSTAHCHRRREQNVYVCAFIASVALLS